MAFPPTPEQQAAIDAFRTGTNMVIQAGAGAGKSSTLRMIAASAPNRRGLYVSFGKAIVEEAKRSFPPNVMCATAHSIAYQAIGKKYRERLNGGRMPAYLVAQNLGIRDFVHLGSDVNDMMPKTVARIALDTVARFCRTADEEIRPHHVPRQVGYDTPSAYQATQQLVYPYAARIWEDLQRTSGTFPFTHDVYLKLYQLSRPTLAFDFILFDEAQDADPLVTSIISEQSTQRVIVGDSAQEIYAWRGALNAMDKFPGQRLTLSKSFRFGHAVAREANRWLDVLDAPLRLTGHDPIPSTIDSLTEPRAILCRTNGGAMREVINHIDTRRVALLGGGDQIKRLAFAAQDLKEGKRTDHPELAAFANWDEVREYVADDSAGSDLAVSVKLIDTYTPRGIIGVVSKLTDERRADLIVSTAHKAKGCEWPTVKIADDFRAPRIDDDGIQQPVQPEEARLAYVAVTRAQHTLDRGSLAWIDTYEPNRPLALAAA